MMKWTIHVYTQRTAQLCWEACGRMMWHWKHNGLHVKTYSEKAGNFLLVQTGLVDKDLDQFYRRLGMRGARASGSCWRQALVLSGVIFTQGYKGRGHALVAAGANTDSYEVV